MIERIDDMPPGTAGFRTWGEFTRADYLDVMLPWMQQAVDAGGPILLLFQIGPDFERFTPGALAIDVTRGAPLGLRHLRAWRRTAVVTDVSWMRHSVELLGWMSPGEVRLFDLDDLPAAKAWLAEPLPE